jgi:hypothetical protein
MTTERLNSVHKNMLDNLDDDTTVDEFFALNECCTDIFGGGSPA